jgi:uroporphyrinogen decarboxylase
MTGRQRVLAALNHQPVDRVPIDLGGTRQSGISVFAYVRLRGLLGLSTTSPPRVCDTFQLLADLDADVLERFGSDTVALNRRCVAFGIPNEGWRSMRLRQLDVLVPGGFKPEQEGDDLVLRRNGQLVARMPRHGFYFDRFEKYPGAAHPDLTTYHAPRLTDADLAHFAREAHRLRAETDKAVIVALGPPYELFNGMGQGGFEDWMMTFASEDEYVAELYRLLVDAWIENLIAFTNVVGVECVHVLQIADDLGTQSGPFLSVEMFREKVMPAYARGLSWIHDNTPWKVLMHTDGAIRPLIPSLIDMGVDALNPIQTSCPGMDPASLRAEFGYEVCLWGASCDPQSTLARGNAEAVRTETESHLEALHPLEGGAVFASIHNIQSDVAPANIVALFDTALHHHEVART